MGKVKRHGSRRRGIGNLPPELIADILSRLSIVPLAQAKYVCKAWHSIIVHDPSFATTHLAASLARTPALLFHYSGLCGGPFMKDDYHPPSRFYLLDTAHEPSHDIHNRRCREMLALGDEIHASDGHPLRLVGSCNGVVCVGVGPDALPAYLYNPVLGECLPLPCDRERHQFVHRTGFGCDPATGDFKVVIFFRRRRDQAEDEHHMDCDVCTVHRGAVLGDAWKHVGRVPSRIYYLGYLHEQGVFLNGRLHWLTRHDSDHYMPALVISFDLHDEKFKMFSCPRLDRGDFRELLLGVLGGKLCLFHNLAHYYLNIWMMKEYGEEGSWVKEYAIKVKHLQQGPFRSWSSRMFYPLTFWRDGDILIERDLVEIGTYNQKTNSLQCVGIYGRPDYFFFPVMMSCPHVCSIVSFKDHQAGTEDGANASWITDCCALGMSSKKLLSFGDE